MRGPRPLVRDATAEDALEVARVHVRSWQAAYRGILPADELAALDPAERARRYTFGEPAAPRTIVAVREGAIVGFATTNPADGEPGSGELHALYIDPPHWGTGVGGTLLAAAEANLATAGFAEAVLWVFAGNERVERFYRAAGWRADGTVREDTFWGLRASVTRYRRALRGS